MNVLHIDSSILGDNSASRQLSRAVVNAWQAADPDLNVSYRDLAAEAIDHFSAATLVAAGTAAELRDAAQQHEAQLSADTLAQFLAADAVVIGAPMYNFTIPVQLKSWFDAIARNGVTFRYTANGPEGQLKGKTAYVALARGGRYRDTALDSQVPLIRTFLGFLGITDVHFIYAEGLNMGPEATAQGFAEAEAEIARLFS